MASARAILLLYLLYALKADNVESEEEGVTVIND